MKRREFIARLGGAAALGRSPRARSSGERMRRIGVLLPATADDAVLHTVSGRSSRRWQQLGWTDGRNVRIDIRWGTGDAESIRKHAAELAALAPDVILAHGGSTV